MLRPERVREFLRLLRERVLVLDGAMGTVIQSYRLGEADYRGERFRDWPKDLKGNNDRLVLTRPDVIGEIHRRYLEAGADIIETNTFGANATTLKAYGMEALNYELNKAGAKLARDASFCAPVDDPSYPEIEAREPFFRHHHGGGLIPLAGPRASFSRSSESRGGVDFGRRREIV